ncbi:hypothetical protein [Fulvitalea axinellae]
MAVTDRMLFGSGVPFNSRLRKLNRKYAHISHNHIHWYDHDQDRFFRKAEAWRHRPYVTGKTRPLRFGKPKGGDFAVASAFVRDIEVGGRTKLKNQKATSLREKEIRLETYKRGYNYNRQQAFYNEKCWLTLGSSLALMTVKPSGFQPWPLPIPIVSFIPWKPSSFSSPKVSFHQRASHSQKRSDRLCCVLIRSSGVIRFMMNSPLLNTYYHLF